MQYYFRIIIEKFSRRGRREAGGGRREAGGETGRSKARDINDLKDFKDFKVMGRSGRGYVQAQKKPRRISVAFKRYCKSATCSQ